MRRSDSDGLRAHSRRVKSEIEHWRRSSRGLPRALSTASSVSRLRQPRKIRGKIPFDSLPANPDRIAADQEDGSPFPDSAIEGAPSLDIDPIWAMVAQHPGTHFASAKTSLWSPTPLATLEAFMAAHSAPLNPLLPEYAPTLPQHISTALLSPLLGHGDLTSVALVSHYLDDLALLDHLDILRAYWLGGDVAYLERVNAALFGKDAAGAGEALGLGKRARTRARLGLGNDHIDNDEHEEQREWGIGLGIGLSERSKWPPGGAELTYALRSAMVDDERSEPANEAWEHIEDKVSYAIKDLPSDERDGRRAKWLNPQGMFVAAFAQRRTTGLMSCSDRVSDTLTTD